MNSKQFLADKADGELCQQRIADRLYRNGYLLVCESVGYSQDFDLVAYETESLSTMKIEVKHDRKAHITGNIFVEFECNGKDSGIYACDSDCVYAIETEHETLYIQRDILNVIACCSGTVKPTKDGKTLGYLVKVDTLREWAIPECELYSLAG